MCRCSGCFETQMNELYNDGKLVLQQHYVQIDTRWALTSACNARYCGVFEAIDVTVPTTSRYRRAKAAASCSFTAVTGKMFSPEINAAMVAKKLSEQQAELNGLEQIDPWENRPTVASSSSKSSKRNNNDNSNDFDFDSSNENALLKTYSKKRKKVAAAHTGRIRSDSIMVSPVKKARVDEVELGKPVPCCCSGIASEEEEPCRGDFVVLECLRVFCCYLVV